MLPGSPLEGLEKGSEPRHGESRPILRIEEELSSLFQTRGQFSLWLLLLRELDQGPDFQMPRSAHAAGESLVPKCSSSSSIPATLSRTEAFHDKPF